MIFSFIFCLSAEEFSFSHTQVEKGLDVFVQKIPDIGVAFVSLRYDFSVTKYPGMPHFFEHLLFEHQIEGDNYDQWLEDAGGYSKAQTGMSFVRFQAKIPAEAMERLLFLETERMHKLCDSLSEEALQNQKLVVIQESINTQLQEAPIHTHLLRKTIFGEHLLGMSVLGDMFELTFWDKDLVCTFLEEEWKRLPLQIFVVGEVDEESVVETIRKGFGKGEREEGIVKLPKPEVGSRISTTGDSTALYVMWPLPSNTHSDSLALQLGHIMLTHSKIGYLQHPSIISQAWIEQNRHGGYFVLRLEGADSKVLEQYLEKQWERLFCPFVGISQRNVNDAQALQRRYTMHARQRLESRALQMERCVEQGETSSCVQPSKLGFRDIRSAWSHWLAWNKASFLIVEAP